MNIIVPDSWLREYLKTDTTPKQIGEYLSLCSQSVENIIKVNKDFIYDIEITSNRPDCLSIYGIARELNAILPRFAIKTKLTPITNYPARIATKSVAGGQLPITKNGLPLEIKISNPALCPRFTCLIFDQVKIAPSPKYIQERLKMSGIRSLNNVIDISNYLMLELGQPMHTFDYDKIKEAKMTMREAKENEQIKTLDGQIRNLPTGTIVIEDGKKRLIDLCGIMGAENSAVDEKTNRVLLFIQAYDPMRIRRTCQQLSFRTEAASRFEKGVDPEGVMMAMNSAVNLFKVNCQADIASQLIDIYPDPPQQKIIKLDLSLVTKIIGIEIPKNDVIDILDSLGFSLLSVTSTVLSFKIPHWRYADVSIPEDLIEELARIYGYFNIPSNIPSDINSRPNDQRFALENKVKTALKYWGFTETVTYSLVSEDILNKVDAKPENHLKILNPLSDDFVYLRQSLIPSLIQVTAQNIANFSSIKIFEMANIYIPQGGNQLPDEVRMLTGLRTGDTFYELKGMIEALFADLGIDKKNLKFIKPNINNFLYHKQKSAQLLLANKPIGILGEIDSKAYQRFNLDSKIVVFDIEFIELLKFANNLNDYKPIPMYPPIIEDLTFVLPEKTEIINIINTIAETNFVQDVVLSEFFGNNTPTFTVTFQTDRNLTSKEVGVLREKIIASVEKKYNAKLKGSLS
ncbi:MAG: phenylalanine--tRNA ligase subunit beta [Candidatus Gottesmanbacteria bacterium]